MRGVRVPAAVIRGAALVAMLAVANGALAASELPDPKQYPSLASLLAWLKSDAKDAKNCSATVAMTLSARAAYDKTASEPKTVETIANALVEKSRVEPERARTLAAGYTRTAVVFHPLPSDAASLAIAELCRSAVGRGDRPFADEALQTRLVADAKKCLSVGFVERPNNPAPLDCVVRTFNRRP